MLAEFLQQLEGLARRANGAEAFKIQDLPEKVMVRKGTEYSIEDVPPARRDHEVHGLSDIVAAVQDEAMAADPEVYHGRSVKLLLDRGDRRDVVTMPLEVTSRFKRLLALVDGESLSVRDAVKLLRFDLHGTGVDQVISAIRRVDFSRTGAGAQSAAHGSESLGRSIEAKVQDADKIPEEFRVQTSVYSNPGVKDLSRVDVRCGVYLDVERECIEIRVLADELENAVNAAQLAIGNALRELLPEVPVFHGAP
ncbi:MAG: hypothetical protein GY711_11455 [bacterium]|nr:hypothetical protein [bacterium]